MQLSKRLEAVLKMIKKANGNSLADIGTDHAFVPIEAVRRGLVTRAIACDINEGPLEAAREHIKEAGLEELIETRLGNGLEPLMPCEADVVCITGMGGRLMKEIIRNREMAVMKATSIIFSPQSELSEFRTYLIDNQFEILEEDCIEEDGKFYFIMRVKYDYLAYGRGAGRPGRFSMFDDLDSEDGYIDIGRGSGAGPGKVAMLTMNNTREYRRSHFAVSDSVEYAKFTAEYGERAHFSKRALATREKYINKNLAIYKSIAERLEGEESYEAKEARREKMALARNLELGLKFEW